MIPQFIRRLELGEEFTVQGDGEQRRSFCYIDDAVAVTVVSALEPRAAGAILNIGNPAEEVSINDLVRLFLSRIAGKHIEPRYVPFEGEGTRRRLPDISRARDSSVRALDSTRGRSAAHIRVVRAVLPVASDSMPHWPISSAARSVVRKTSGQPLFLGFLPPVNSMRALGVPADSEPWHPAELLVCPSCHLAQLGYVVEPAVLFPPEYPYTSGSTRVLRENFAELHREVDELVGLTSADLVVDVGSNDGTLLAAFRDDGHRVLGIEPTRTAEIARDRGIETMSASSMPGAASEAVSRHGTARVVTAANVFAHIPDIHAVVDAIASMLAPNGVFVSESGYFRDLVETLQYDTIYHEHLRYYSLTSLSALLEAHGFRVVHAKRIPTHGGSIRVYATRGPEPGQSSVAELLEEEISAGLTDESWVDAFRERVTQSKSRSLPLAPAEIEGSGGRIYGIGAPSRASTLVNYVGLDDGIVNYVLEIAGSMKVGKYLPGTAIPVVEESKLFEDQPEFALLLSWHIGGELKANLRKKGFAGRFIVPLPEPRIET